MHFPLHCQLHRRENPRVAIHCNLKSSTSLSHLTRNNPTIVLTSPAHTDAKVSLKLSSWAQGSCPRDYNTHHTPATRLVPHSGVLTHIAPFKEFEFNFLFSVCHSFHQSEVRTSTHHGLLAATESERLSAEALSG